MVKKRELLLTIDDLKKLGIIKKYLRKRRRNKRKLKLMNNNIKQNSDHMNGYSEPVISNQQQVYRQNDLDNQIKYKQLENLDKQSTQLLLENGQPKIDIYEKLNDYFQNANDQFSEEVVQLKDQMNRGVGEINNIYKLIKEIKIRPIELQGRNENIESLNEKNVFELLDDEINNPIEPINEQPIATTNNEQPIEPNNKQLIEKPNEEVVNTMNEMLSIVELKADIQNLRDVLYEQTHDKKYLEYNYQISKRTITILTNQLITVKAKKQKEEEEMIKNINKKQKKMKKKLS